MPIPKGYARVMVDRVEKGWEDLNLEILGGDGEEELQHALHTWICWNKRYIRFPQGSTDPAASAHSPRPRSPTPTPSMSSLSPHAQRDPSMGPPSPPTQREPNMDPQSPPTQRDPSMSPLPPPKVKKNTNAWVPPLPPPKVKKNPAKKKEKPPPPKLAYETTQEELNEHVRKEVREQFAPRKPEPKQLVDPAGQKFFITMCQPRKKKKHSRTTTTQS
jgi:hypothetical protein